MIRRALLILLCLLASAALQWAVAWVLFVTVPYTGRTGLVVTSGAGGGGSGIRVESHTGFRPPTDWDNRFLQRDTGFGKTREVLSEMEWMGSRPMLRMDGTRQAYYSGFAAGWPLRSLAGTDSINAGLERCAPAPLVDVPTWLLRGGWKVPASPLWPGFIVNTLLYVGLVWGAVRGVPAWRRWRRRKRGLCEGCGYDLHGLAAAHANCPECGRERSDPAPPATIPP